MSKSAGGSRETHTSQTGMDAGSREYMERMWKAAEAAGQAGPSPLVTGATDYNSGAMAAGNMGLGAMSGNAANVQSLMNPYQQQVVGGINQQWDQTDQRSMNAVNDRATQAGAFGGSRHGVATGTALAQNNMNRNSQVGGLLYGGFNDAMGRAGDLARYGFAGAGANANLGMGGVGSPQQWMLEMMKNGWQGATGSQSSGAKAGVATEAGFKLPFLS